MSLEDLKIQIQRRKDMREVKGKLSVLDSVNNGILKLIDEFKKLREGQSNEVVVKNLPEPVKEVTVSNFPKQNDTVKVIGDVSLKQPKWFSLKGIEKSLKTLSDRIEKAVFKVDLDKYQRGTEAIAVKLVDKDGKPYVAKGGTGAYPTFGSMNLKDTNGSDINPATKEGQEDIVEAIGNITIPAPVGGATEAKQDSQITLQTTIASLAETILELSQRIAFLGSIKQHQTESLRVTPVSSVSTAVTGSLTSAGTVTSVGTLTNFGTGIPASEMAHDINNQMVTLCNINNVTP